METGAQPEEIHRVASLAATGRLLRDRLQDVGLPLEAAASQEVAEDPGTRRFLPRLRLLPRLNRQDS